jgi:hypothetical protein
MKWLLIVFVFFTACTGSKNISFPARQNGNITGAEFYRIAAAYNGHQRDSLALVQFTLGNIPGFLKKFVAVKVSIFDSVHQKKINAVYYVSPDYFSVGTDDNWCRIPLTPMAATRIADSVHCFLPTRKMVNDIYNSAKIKLEPVPMYAFRDSSPTMYQHHLVIEGQRQKRKGLIAGIKKDVVITGQLTRADKMNRVAIYGWHKSDGKPIQPLYTGHVNWYVDYSHGIRLVYSGIKIGKRWMDYTDVLKDPILRGLLCDEEYCDYYKYPY